MGTDEPGSSSNQNGDTVAGTDTGRGTDPFFPSGSTPVVGTERATRRILRKGIGGGRSKEEDQDQAQEDKRPKCELCKGGVPPQSIVNVR